MEKNNDTTIVIFRRFKAEPKEVIALLPELAANKGHIMSYMHIGQHGEASYPGIIKMTSPAYIAEDDTKDLYNELESIGYRLIILPHINNRTKRRYNSVNIKAWDKRLPEIGGYDPELDFD